MLVRVTLACVSVFVTGTGRCKIAHIAGISGRHLAAPAPLTRRGGGQSQLFALYQRSTIATTGSRVHCPPLRRRHPGTQHRVHTMLQCDNNNTRHEDTDMEDTHLQDNEEQCRQQKVVVVSYDHIEGNTVKIDCFTYEAFL